MKGFKFISGLLLATNVILVQSKVTFRVISVSGETPYVIINNEKYAMKEEEYPIFTTTLDLHAPVNYHYALDGKEEKFTRTLKIESTLNEFFNREINVKKHPLLPKAYESFAYTKKSKLYDDTFVSTVLIEGTKEDINYIHSRPDIEKLKVPAKVIYVSPYTVKKFNKAKVGISGQSTVYFKKLSYKLSGLKTEADGKLFNRSSVKLRANLLDASFIKEKIYYDMLNSLGVPSAQCKFTRVFVNKKPVGLFLMTDDFDNKEFLKNTFNKGKKSSVTNHIFKADYYPEGKDHAVGDLKYYGESSNKYNIYEYKGDLEDVDSRIKVKEILVPFLKELNNYSSGKSINFDIDGFLRNIAMEFLGYASDNFWIKPGNFYIYKDNTKNKWYFIDSDFDQSFGHGYPMDALKTTIDNFASILNDDHLPSARPVIDLLRKIPAHDKYLKSTIKRLLQTSFNINAVGPRIDSLAELIKEDALWDYKCERQNKYTGRPLFNYKYDLKEFERQVFDTSSIEHYPIPLKAWIITRSKNVASQLGITIPTKPDTSLGYYEPKYENSKKDKDDQEDKEEKKEKKSAKVSAVTKDNINDKKSKTSDLPITIDKCGAGVGRCASGYCCSEYGYCGKTSIFCGKGCQSKYGFCHGGVSDLPILTLTGKCGAGVGRCASGYCCSEHGYCGKTSSFCGKGGQSKYGKCN